MTYPPSLLFFFRTIMSNEHTQICQVSLRGGGSQRRHQTAPFISGPIPLHWIQSAARLKSQSAVTVGLSLFFQAGLTKSLTVRFTRKVREQFNISDSTGFRALCELESAGLIAVDRQSGCCHSVTILKINTSKNRLPYLEKVGAG